VNLSDFKPSPLRADHDLNCLSDINEQLRAYLKASALARHRSRDPLTMVLERRSEPSEFVAYYSIRPMSHRWEDASSGSAETFYNGYAIFHFWISSDFLTPRLQRLWFQLSVKRASQAAQSGGGNVVFAHESLRHMPELRSLRWEEIPGHSAILLRMEDILGERAGIE